MMLFFDARYIRTDFHDGISRYSTELGRALSALTPVTFMIHDKAQLAFLPEGARHIVIHPPTSIKEFVTARILNRFSPDVVFSPMQTMGTGGRTFKLILTSHDMIYYRHRSAPRGLHSIIRVGWWIYHLSYVPQRAILNSADIVATVSQTSKKDFIKANLTHRPIIVIPNAPQRLSQYVPAKAVSDGTPRNLIYMGSFMGYKNVETLVRAMELLPDHTLHLLSRISPKRRSELETYIAKGAKVIFHNGVSDQQYAKLLANKAVLVTASLDEGYGLPIAEALALGVPAVVSNIPIFHEVAGDGALYFKAKDPMDFANKVNELASPALRKRITTAGKKHIGTFSWDISAQTLLTTIKSSLLQ